MSLLKPRRISTETVARLRFVEVRRHRLQRDGSAAEWEAVTFECPDWVSVVPVTPEGEFVLVRQHRHGIDALSVEVPGGLIDPGEAPAAAAERELVEETGYAGAELVPLGWCHPNPALQGNRHYMFLARDVAKRSEPHFDPGELCETLVWTAEQVRAAIRDGTIHHSLALLALSRAMEGAAEREVTASLVGLLEQMEALQIGKVAELARRIRPGLTLEDLRNPHDFPELEDSDWQFADGQLAGIQSVLVALRARLAGGAR